MTCCKYLHDTSTTKKPINHHQLRHSSPTYKKAETTRHLEIYRIFFRRSRSSRSFWSMTCEEICVVFPVFQSFCLFKNQSGILNCLGFWMMATSFSISSAVISPALENRQAGVWGKTASNRTWAIEKYPSQLHYKYNATWV